MKILQKEAPAPYSMLTLGKLQGCSGDLFRWEAPANMDFYVAALMKDSNRDAVVKALTTAMGVTARFEAVKAGSVLSEAAQDTEDQFVKSITEAFGAANVSIQEEKH